MHTRRRRRCEDDDDDDDCEIRCMLFSAPYAVAVSLCASFKYERVSRTRARNRNRKATKSTIMKMYTHKQMAVIHLAFGRVPVFVHALDWVGFRSIYSSHEMFADAFQVDSDESKSH